MGGTSSRNKKDFQSVVPYSGSNTPAKKVRNESVVRVHTDIPIEKTRCVPPAPLSDGPKREPSGIGGWTPNEAFNFDYTEGQSRRQLMATCEEECSQVTDFLYVGGAKVAGSREILRQHNITRIINFAPSVVENHFIDDDSLTYLSIDMIDGRQDDISWFFCEVIQFIEIGRHSKLNTLLHCERGVSRSCSFAIAYLMWASESSWKSAFDYVKSCRAACAPNTGFTCNLIELDELLHGESRNTPIFFRCASHLPHDRGTPVLKLVRNPESRKIVHPRSSLLHSGGVFVVRPAAGDCKCVYVWKGRDADPECLKITCILVQQIMGVFCEADTIEVIDDMAEPVDFRDHIIQEGAGDVRSKIEFDDLFVCEPDSLKETHRRRSIGTVTGLGHMQTDSTIDRQMSMGSQHPIEEQHSQGGGVERIVIKSHVSAGFLLPLEDPPGELVASPSSLHKPNQLALKRNLSMNTSDSSVTVERRAIVNTTNCEVPGDTVPSVSADNAVTINDKPVPPLCLAGKGSTGDLVMVDAEADVVKVVTEVIGSALSPGKQSTKKPQLFQCVRREGGDIKWQWQHFAVYDDDDLDEHSLFFLRCVDEPHYLWVGTSFRVPADFTCGAAGDSKGGHEPVASLLEASDSVDSILRKFAAEGVARGDVHIDSSSLRELLSIPATLSIARYK